MPVNAEDLLRAGHQLAAHSLSSPEGCWRRQHVTNTYSATPDDQHGGRECSVSQLLDDDETAVAVEMSVAMRRSFFDPEFDSSHFQATDWGGGKRRRSARASPEVTLWPVCDVTVRSLTTQRARQVRCYPPCNTYTASSTLFVQPL